MSNDNTTNTLSAVGGMFRWGSGILGKTAIAFAVFEAAGFAAIFNLHSDGMIMGVLALMMLAFFAWYLLLLRFCDQHPAETLLEGIHWAQYQQQQMSKGQPVITIDPHDSSLGIVPEAKPTQAAKATE